tara:strand:- start:344 stop:934 length:591 start_codon:yes stop_codon:yes gene_type:complete
MSFFEQKIKVSSKFISRRRVDVIPDYCVGKDVLHIGCMDWPITNYSNNLHIAVDKVCNSLVGIDMNDENFEEMKGHVSNKELYVDISKMKNRNFDIMLIPEVIEHVDNVQDFLKTLANIKASKIIITVPDAFLCSRNHFRYLSNSEFVEIVHPDHNCWFSPYTLKNIVGKFTDWSLEEMFFLENMSIMGVFKTNDV